MGIKELESYTNEQSNPGIKKYIAVIKEYQRKYKKEVEIPTTSNLMSLNNSLKTFLTSDKINENLSKEENLLYYWIYETMNLSPTVKKDELDSIIEGKKMLPSDVLANKVKEFS